MLTGLLIEDKSADSLHSAISSNAAVSIVPKVGGLHFFNQIVQTTSSPLTVTVTNNQSAPVTINSITSTADYPFTSSCVDSSGTGTLAPQASCTIDVSFDPQAVGSRPGTLSIAESADASPISVPLAGLGIAGAPGPTIVIAPDTPCVQPLQTQQFTATVTGTSNQAVDWYVDSVLNGDRHVGTISAGGLYTAPSIAASHTITAVSQALKSISGNTNVNVTSTPLFAIYPFSTSLLPSGTQTFQAQVCYVPDSQPVTWTVDNIPGGNSTVGTVTSAGVYTAPATTGKHTVRVTDSVLGKTSGSEVTVYSNISVDFGSRTSTAHPIPANLIGYGRGESMHNTADRTLITQAGVTVSRLYAQIPLVYATPTPDWTKVDPLIASIQAAGQHAMLQVSYTPPWLQPSPNPCGAGNQVVPPTDISKWAQIAASYVAHMDAAFPGVIEDYEIWNEPNTSGLCSNDRLNKYISIYAAAAPLMKQQAAADGAPIRIGGPVLSGDSGTWISALLSNPSTKPYVDFISYHQYLFGVRNLQVRWDTYNGKTSMYQQMQDPNFGPAGVYKRVKTQVGAAAPVYVTEFNTNWSFFQDCCKNDPVLAPLWNALYISDMLNTAYSGLPPPGKLIYFAGSAYPYFCLVGIRNPTMDCNYSAGSTPQPYPQYYAYQLLSSSNYLDLVDGGYMATSIAPAAGGGGLVVTAFYTASQNAIVIVNPTATTYSQLPVNTQNLGFATPSATLYQIVNGASISSSSIGLIQSGSGYSASVDIPAYSVQAIAITGTPEQNSRAVNATVSASPEPSVYPAPFTASATLTAVNGSATPTGTVTFSIDGTAIGTAPLANGTATAGESAAVAAGSHTITAAYSGDANFDPATFSGTHVVSSAPPVVVPTATTLQGSPNPSPADQPVVFTATVNAGGTVPSGQVTLADDTTQLGTVALDASGVATLTTSALGVGSHTITATYAGPAEFAASSAAAVQQITPLTPPALVATTTSVTAAPVQSQLGQSVTFTAGVSASSGTPSGLVTFLDGTTNLGQPSLSAQGTATFSTSTLSVGTHTISAAYQGDTAFAPSTSSPLIQLVQAVTGPADFNLEIAPSNISAFQGVPAVYAVTVTAINQFNGVINFTCSVGGAAEATCGFAPQAVTGSGTTTLTVLTTAAHPTAALSNSARSTLLMGGLFCCLLLRKKKLRSATVLMILVLAGTNGCGSNGDLGTRQRTYAITVTGASTSNGAPLTHTVSAQLKVL